MRDNFRSSCFKTCAALLFAIRAIPSTSYAQTAPVDTAPQVKLRFAETVSSATAKVGQSILLDVIEPVEVDGKLTVAAGAHAHAIVSGARHRGHNRREGTLLLNVQSVSQVDGTEAHLQSMPLRKGSGVGSSIFGSCTFPTPVDPVGLFRKGNDVVVPKGTELIATLALEHP